MQRRMISPEAPHGFPDRRGPQLQGSQLWLRVWVLLTLISYSFLPQAAWQIARWFLIVLLVIEVIYLGFRKYHRPA